MTPFEIFKIRGWSNVGRSSIYTYLHWSHILLFAVLGMQCTRSKNTSKIWCTLFAPALGRRKHIVSVECWKSKVQGTDVQMFVRKNTGSRHCSYLGPGTSHCSCQSSSCHLDTCKPNKHWLLIQWYAVAEWYGTGLAVASSNLTRGSCVPTPTQRAIPTGSVNQ